MKDPPNVQLSPVKLDVATLADATPPVFEAGFPRSASVSDYFFAIEGRLDEASELHVVCVPAGDPAPAASQVIAGTASDGSAPTFAGSATAAASATARVEVAANLQPATAYAAYVVARDTTSGSNEQLTAVKVAVVTGPDATPPVMSAAYPQVANVSDSYFDVLVQLDEPGAAFVVVVPDASTAPTPLQVRLGQDSSGGVALAVASAPVAASATPAVVRIPSGMAPSTAYDVYVTATDAASNPQGLAYKVDVTTAVDISPPKLEAPPEPAEVSDVGCGLRVRMSEPAKCWYVPPSCRRACHRMCLVLGGLPHPCTGVADTGLW